MHSYFICFESSMIKVHIFWEGHLLLTTVHTVKSKGKISQNFVAFSEYMNFKCQRNKFDNFQQLKVHIFWESHNFLRNLHPRFVLCSNGQICGGDFANFVAFSKYMNFNNTVAGHFNPRLWASKIQPRTYLNPKLQPQAFQLRSLQQRTFQLHTPGP